MTGADRRVFLAFDFGSHSIGVAAGTALNNIPMPLTAVRVLRSGPDWEGLEDLVREWDPAGFVVGLALNSKGEDTVSSRRARKFGGRLRERYNRPVHWIDETLSTEAARRVLREARPDRAVRKSDIDNTAAALILETFLNTQR
ncbi:MAG: Holliday junction resolvase RuvX [Arenicellales bacterium]